MDLKIDLIGNKLLNAMSLGSISFIEIVKNFSSQNPLDWQQIKTYYSELDSTHVPKQSMLYLQSELDKLAEKEYVSVDGDKSFFAIWQVNFLKLAKEETLNVVVPKSLDRLLKKLADADSTSVDFVINTALNFYINQRHFKLFNQADYIKITVVDNFGTNTFSKEDLLSLLKYSGIYHMIDMSLESYCINNTADKNRFLIRLPDGSYQLSPKKE